MTVTTRRDASTPGAVRALGLRHLGLLVLLANAALVTLLVGLVLSYQAGLAEHEHGLALMLGATGALGVLLIGTFVGLFFTRLTADIDRLHARALAVMAGDRSPHRALRRDDELGQLSMAQESMVRALAAGEQALEIERRHLFHQEKMAALGAMAAGVLNDIGNPIAAIDGLARAMIEARASGDCGPGNPLCDPALVLRETTRLQLITRQIAELAAPPATEVRLLSLNEVVASTLLLLHFDVRLRGVCIDTKLDAQLPALHAIGDQLVQLLMNLVVNAADAVRSAQPAQPLITVKTSLDLGFARLSVADNGCGMDTHVLSRAFEPLFTTKPAGRGTGLGLPLCRSVAAGHGGRIELTSSPGRGTEASVWLPLAPGGAP